MYKGEKEPTSVACAKTPGLLSENGIAMTLRQGESSA